VTSLEIRAEVVYSAPATYADMQDREIRFWVLCPGDRVPVASKQRWRGWQVLTRPINRPVIGIMTFRDGKFTPSRTVAFKRTYGKPVCPKGMAPLAGVCATAKAREMVHQACGVKPA
jgi:hypothetical protein